MPPRNETAPASPAASDDGPASGGAKSDNDADADDAAEPLIMGYTHAQCVAALESIKGPAAATDGTCRHIFGHGDPAHRLSMLQKVTAVRILDYAQNQSGLASVDDLERQAAAFHSRHGPMLHLRAVVQSRAPAMCLAAEFKRASPSKGLINPGATAAAQAATYGAAGASVISVLTEEHWFQGSLDDLRAARLATTGQAYRRPAILRKEFVFGTYQIYEAAAHGADTILLIVAVTPADLLKVLVDTCREVGMEPLVEVHGQSELDVALNAGARVIGVNNRNLHTFQMDLATTDRTAEELAKRGIRFDHRLCSEGGGAATAATMAMPEYALCSLSGMSSPTDVDRYRQIGVGMCLIGESLMRAADPAAAIAGLCLDPADYDQRMMDAAAAGGAYTAGTKIVKVCGITTAEDALVACRAHANLIGVIFAPKSKRCVTAEQAADVVRAVRDFGERSGRIGLACPGNNVAKMAPVQALFVKARALEEAARRPLVVGVFQNQPAEFIREMVDTCGLDMVQLHGQEGMEAASEDICGVPALRVVDIETSTDGSSSKAVASTDAVQKILDGVTSDPAAILLDTSIKGSKEGGGTGVTFDHSIAEQLQNRGLPVIIAGGLKPGNVKDAVMKTRPWGIDVSSGVEQSPGKKNHDAVTKFVGGARDAAIEASKGF